MASARRATRTWIVASMASLLCACNVVAGEPAAGEAAAEEGEPRAERPAGSDVESLGPGDETRIYYQFIDDKRRVRFVERLADVPEQWREQAGFVEMSSPPPLSPADARATRDERYGGALHIQGGFGPDSFDRVSDQVDDLQGRHQTTNARDHVVGKSSIGRRDFAAHLTWAWSEQTGVPVVVSRHQHKTQVPADLIPLHALLHEQPADYRSPAGLRCRPAKQLSTDGQPGRLAEVPNRFDRRHPDARMLAKISVQPRSPGPRRTNADEVGVHSCRLEARSGLPAAQLRQAVDAHRARLNGSRAGRTRRSHRIEMLCDLSCRACGRRRRRRPPSHSC